MDFHRKRPMVRDPRLELHHEPSYAPGERAEIEVLRAEKRELKMQADALYSYKEHLKQELEKSKGTVAKLKKDLEIANAEKEINLEKLDEITKDKSYYYERYHSLKRKMEEQKEDDNRFRIKYDDLEVEFQEYRNKYAGKAKSQFARLCYNGTKCHRRDCTYAHSVQELALCPKGKSCTIDCCPYFIHTETGRMLFTEYYCGKDHVFCRDFDVYNTCAYHECNKIHYDSKTKKF